MVKAFSCGSCLNMESYDFSAKTVFCSHFAEQKKMVTALHCPHFYPRHPIHERWEDIPRSSYDNLPIRSRTCMCLGTRKQWLDAGYRVKEGERGRKMHPRSQTRKTCVYFYSEQVEEIP